MAAETATSPPPLLAAGAAVEDSARRARWRRTEEEEERPSILKVGNRWGQSLKYELRSLSELEQVVVVVVVVDDVNNPGFLSHVLRGVDVISGFSSKGVSTFFLLHGKIMCT